MVASRPVAWSWVWAVRSCLDGVPTVVWRTCPQAVVDRGDVRPGGRARATRPLWRL